MEVVTDEPGRGLVIEETATRMPLGLFLGAVVLVLLIATPWRGLWAVAFQGSDLGNVDLIGSLIWLVIGLLVVLSLRGGSRIERIAADRENGIAVRSTHAAGFVGWTRRVPIEALQGFTLDVAPGGVRRGSGRPQPLPLRLTLKTGKGPRRPLSLSITKVDRTSEVADLALRAGAAVGLPYYRVVGSDAEQFEIELLRTAEPDAKTVPALGGAADYARDMVAAPASAAAADKARRFDPATFEGMQRVVAWEPRQRVRFEKPWSASVLASPLLLAGLLGPFAWWRLPSLHTMPAVPRVVALGLITLVGLAIALIGGAGLTAGRPRRVTLDWATRSLSVEGAVASRSVTFSEIEAIELRLRNFRSRHGQRQYIVYYWCEVRAILRSAAGPSADELLAETQRYREDRITPHVKAVPLATELAAALDVEKRETSS